ncbi:helix-turn-helix transcriptional regulator [Allopontixanthobacter confluentis]|uniref:helix-turn-helix transcriptional regulator n=1 Tax=Allopontixanthobacter confluentis TaxID=1849021 RepID=UPI00136B5425
MERAIAQISTNHVIGDIFRLVRSAARNYGAVRHSYHFTPIFHSQTSEETVVDSAGFPPHWISLYEDRSFRTHDPIPDYIMGRGELLRWSTAIEETVARGTDEKVLQYFQAMRDSGLVHGIGIPVFGPRNRNAYMSYGFDDPRAIDDSDACSALRAIAQAAHTQICLLQDRRSDHVILSAREKQVLEWIARGKSNTDIADILNISPDTIATYVKRLFLKLEARERVGATIKALRMGLISL